MPLNEYVDPEHGPRGAELAIAFRKAVHFQLDDTRMHFLVTACEIHNGALPQSDPTIGVCLDADRLDLPRVGITPDPELLSTTTAQERFLKNKNHQFISLRLPSYADSIKVKPQNSIKYNELVQ